MSSWRSTNPVASPGSDLGNNFFLEEESLGRSRAREMTRFVCELNPDVEGQAREEVSDLWA